MRVNRSRDALDLAEVADVQLGVDQADGRAPDILKSVSDAGSSGLESPATSYALAGGTWAVSLAKGVFARVSASIAALRKG